jgi:hypothetical protein
MVAVLRLHFQLDRLPIAPAMEFAIPLFGRTALTISELITPDS